MTVLTAAVVLFGALTGLNLVLTLGVVRRLRAHSEQLTILRATGGPVDDYDIILGVGERPAEFTATTVDGERVSGGWLAGPALVGFFSPSCTPCKDWMPRFAEAAATHPGPALAVVASGGADGPDLAAAAAEVAALEGPARVVVEPVEGPVQQAFAVRGWPAMCRLGADGTVVSTANHEVVALPVGR